MVTISKLSLVSSLLLPVIFVSPLAAQPSPPVRLGLSVGMESHGDWAESSIGPTAAISLLSRFTPHLAIQSMVSGSGGIPTSGKNYLACAGCPTPPDAPSTALGAGAELVLSKARNQAGVYFLGGVGVMHYAGGTLNGARTHAVVDLGIGSALGHRTSQFFVEARLTYVVSPGAFPSWHAPLRIGWRTRK